MRSIRGDRIAMIFQEPMTSLNPVLTHRPAADRGHRGAHVAAARRGARSAPSRRCDAVRISEPERRLTQYPHELSGGMRQRVMIAMALALRPDVLIADEPTTALDVTVQAQVLDLLRDLQRELGTAIILITHDMGVVAEMADRVIVMQHGRMVEERRRRPALRRAAAAPTPARCSPPCRASAAGTAAPATSAAGAGRQRASMSRDLHVALRPARRHSSAASPTASTPSRGVSFAIRARRDLGAGRRNPAAASRPPPRRLPAWCPSPATSRSAAATSPASAATARSAVRRDVQMIFQDPYASLDPRMRVGDLVAEPLVIHGIGTPAERARARSPPCSTASACRRTQIEPLSARILRRPAPAHLHRPRAGAAARS